MPTAQTSTGKSREGAAKKIRIQATDGRSRQGKENVQGIRETEQKGRRERRKQICQELMVHAQLEEEIFYPAVRLRSLSRMRILMNRKLWSEHNRPRS